MSALGTRGLKNDQEHDHQSCLFRLDSIGIDIKMTLLLNHPANCPFTVATVFRQWHSE
ncbi:hypothetical protein AVEN_160766-1, partial [Araneus ventricosus]